MDESNDLQLQSVPIYGAPQPREPDGDDFLPTSSRTTGKVFSRLGWGLTLLMVVSTIMQLLMLSLPVLLPDSILQLISDNALFYATLPIYIFGVPACFLLLRKMPVDERLQHRKLSVGSFFAALVICITAMIVGNIISLLLMSLLELILPAAAENPVESSIASSRSFTAIFTLCVCAPVMEELVFRKILLDRISVYGDKIAIVISGVLFGIFHGNFYQFFYATLLGMILAWVYLRSGKIILPMLMHGFVNLLGGVVGPFVVEYAGDVYDRIIAVSGDTAALTALLPSLSSGEMGALAVMGVYLVFIYGLAITGLVIFIVKRRSIIFTPALRIIPKGQRFSSTIVNPGMIAFIIVMMVSFVLSLL